MNTEANEYIVPILKYPDERLHQQCVEVTEFDSDLIQLGRCLLFTMKSEKGIGLAAPQIGVLKNVIAIWIDEKIPIVLVNPKLIDSSEELLKFNEGCLSVPGYFEDRERPKKIVVKFNDVNGGEHQVEFFDLYAFCIQHEIDHLNGKVFIDNLSDLKRSRIKSKIRKSQK